MGDDPDGGPVTVPIDSIPAPVIAYEVPEDDPVITGTNDPFDAAFDAVATGTSVRRWLREAVGAGATRVDDICSRLASGGHVDAEFDASVPGARSLDPGRYRIRTFEKSPDGTETGGLLLLIETAADDADSVETDRIASVISHDLRNPLDVANAHLRAARETGETHHFDQVRQSHDRMEQIIEDVLTLARGKSALSISEGVDIETVAADAWTTVDTRDASLSLEDGLPDIRADPDRLQRLFENLFRNSVEHARPTDGASSGPPHARDATDDSDGSLQVRVGSDDGGFFVADNGPGVPADARDRVFDPGYSRTETGGGTGLGLTIVEEIADAHDWTISLTAGQHGGARFEFHPFDRDVASL